VNASTWGLMLTGHLVNVSDPTRADAPGAFKRLIARAGEPVIRLAVRQAMRIMGHQFVMGRTIEEALDRSAKGDNAKYRYSYDMLGEAAFTAPDAARYKKAYHDAILALGRRGPFADMLDAPSISVKLSALHPRYEVAKRERVHAELTPVVLELAQLAKAQGIALTIDAEEADRLELSLDVMEAVFTHPSLEGWNGFGLAVQAYQKRAPFVIDWLIETAKAAKRRWCVRLVKGAYWDSEIKRAQELGLSGYPVFTRKPNTDVSYLANAKRMLDAGADVIYPQFATHNAHTIAAIHHIAKGRPFEFQRLHGMGADLYAEVVGDGSKAPNKSIHGLSARRVRHRSGLGFASRWAIHGPRVERAVPRVRTMRQPRRPVAIPGTPPAGERRQHQLRQPHQRRQAADQRTGRRPLRRSTRVWRRARRPLPAPPYSPADRPVRHTPEEFHGRESCQRRRT
jgi:RHH-type proline utilization regulon transcriptional repressor/proline dehydrogenase/delta 1-pyrroline-5-carboxylate dehydrogenase